MGDTDSTYDNQSRPPKGFGALTQFINEHRVDAALWTTRVLTIIFALGYFIPIFGNPYSLYNRVLITNAATSALRLHQRIPRVSFSKEYLAMLLQEDSCHYLLYSLMFMYVAPVTLVLLPVFLFAVLHSASYSLTLLDTLGQNSWWGARLLISLVEFQSRNILRLISFTEIFLMPFTIVLLFMGKAGLITPFVYYQFLTLRYASRRNPYTRNMFYELKLLIENFAHKNGTPSLIRNFLLSVVAFTSRLSPPMQQEQ